VVVLACVVVLFYDEDFSAVFFFLCYPEFFYPVFEYLFQTDVLLPFGMIFFVSAVLKRERLLRYL